MKFDFQHLQSLLRYPVDHAEVIQLIGGDKSIIDRDEYYGSVEFKKFGVELVLKEAPWVLPQSEITNAKALYVCAFHFHRGGHEGFKQYAGSFPNGIGFNDSEADIRDKLRQLPLTTGGGGISSILKSPLPRWLRYSLANEFVHFQLDSDARLEMVTLEVENANRSRASK